MPDNFKAAIEKTLRHEGGYVDDSQDPGGRTNFGISQRAYPWLNISDLSREQAVEIYRRDFWNAPGIYRITDSEIASKVFDLGVNIGPAHSVRMLQRAVNYFQNHIKVDGNLGPHTARAVNDHAHPQALLMALRIEAGIYYFSLGKPQYLAGWLNRLAD